MKPVMRESFERYGEIAKDFAKPKANQPKGLTGALDYALAKAAEKFGNDQAAQFEIFTIQQDKQKIMADLKAALKELDNSETEPVGEQKITKGELLTDIQWDVKHDLEIKSMPRAVRKEYLVEVAKNKLLALADKQILKQMLASRDVDEYKKHAYSALKRERETGAESAGRIAEKMVQSLLRKIAIDHDLDFDIQAADVAEDVERKIDFIVVRKSRGRGVQVEANEGVDRLGVQLTINANQEVLQGKREQIKKAKARLRPEDKIEDLVLVQMNVSDVIDLNKKWKAAGKPPGGPDKLLPTNIKEQIFKKVLQGFYSPAELEAAWSNISG